MIKLSKRQNCQGDNIYYQRDKTFSDYCQRDKAVSYILVANQFKLFVYLIASKILRHLDGTKSEMELKTPSPRN